MSPNGHHKVARHDHTMQDAKKEAQQIGSLAIHKVSIYVTKHQSDDVEGMAENKTATKCLEAQNRTCSVQKEMAPGQSAMKQEHT